ncbi:glycosyltransferase family 4 protein [Vibrio parahaemolyticus]|uniref:glycosyltransferase family 4 protein n=1 Tax=Vibrio parahaemolyticus TaxID=670 RepID=UPI001E536FF3|nr:glycosyltransferase family 4 protein [Vibrio parahaemolyticus]ELB2133734.1 glycosyltransferase family 4 protein [Vibrio parahaemolyticus]MCQ9046642.1 glycosyltransferase family 4 protein [Vibrio parahaemolyticus]
MHIALLIDDYLPHSTRVAAKMFHELARSLVAEGHRVTVITPFEHQREKLRKSTLDGVNVWYFSSGPIKDTGKVRRAINETLLSVRAWHSISKEVSYDPFDGVVYYSPSIFLGYLVSKLKSHCSCRAYLVLRDLFPQWVVDAGLIKKGSLIEKYFRLFETYSYQQADMIGLMSERNKILFDQITDELYVTEVLRNWAELKPHTTSSKVSLKKRLKLEEKVLFFYGGNIGHAQDMSNLMRLTKKMSCYENAHFLYLGQGDEVHLINDLAKKWKLTNFTYLPSVDQQEFKDILSEVDVGLFSLSSQHTAHNFPGKLLGYMVQSIPILGSVNQGNDLLEIVNNNEAGFISVNGQDDILFNNAKLLYEEEERRRTIGANAFSLLERDFSVQSAAKLITRTLKKK